MAPTLSSKCLPRSSHVLATADGSPLVDPQPILLAREHEELQAFIDKYSVYIVVGAPFVITALAYAIYRFNIYLRGSKGGRDSKKRKAASKKDLTTNLRLIGMIPTPTTLGDPKNGDLPRVYAPPNIMVTPATASPSKLKFPRDLASLGDGMDERGYEYGKATSSEDASSLHARTSSDSTLAGDLDDGQDITYAFTPQTNPSYLPSQVSPSPRLVQPMPQYFFHAGDLEGENETKTYLEANPGTPSSVVLSSLASRIEVNNHINMSTWDRTRARSCFTPPRSVDTTTRARSTPPSRPNAV